MPAIDQIGNRIMMPPYYESKLDKMLGGAPSTGLKHDIRAYPRSRRSHSHASEVTEASIEALVEPIGQSPEMNRQLQVASMQQLSHSVESLFQQAQTLPWSQRQELAIRLFEQPNTEAARPEMQSERSAALDDICGKYAHVNTSVDDFLARKREEIDLEERRYR
jgi:hypothetical protein